MPQESSGSDAGRLPMGARAICFDAAGTLFTVREPVGVTYARIAAAHELPLDAASLEHGFRQALRCAPPLAFPGVHSSHLPSRERGWWHAVVTHALRAAGAADASPVTFDRVFDALFHHYATAEAWRCYDDATGVLTNLRGLGYRLAVVSNFDSRLPGIMEDLALTPLVDTTVYSVQAGAAKPAAAIFHRALAALHVQAAHALHVGDDLASDVKGAQAAGLAAVLIDRTRPTEKRDLPGTPVIGSLRELPRILSRAGAG